MIYTPRIKTDAMINPPSPQRITLPAAPFDIPPATHDETAPRSLPVRGGIDVNGTSIMERRARELFQYAESQGWKCTISQAADAIGMNLMSAKSEAHRLGFIHRFAGYHAKPRLRERENNNASIGSLGAMARGFDVDENLVPLDRLIR